MTRRLSPATVRAALWALHALRLAQRHVRTVPIADFALPAAPALPAASRRGVEAVLRRRPHTCLEGSLVRQAWFAGQGVARDVIIGSLTSPRFSAHAWLEGEPSAYDELLRLPPAVGERAR